MLASFSSSSRPTSRGATTDLRATVKVAIVGAGIGGLATACHLVGRGHDVSLYEAGDDVGGKACQRSVDGFRLDLGPTVLTMPAFLEATLRAAGAAPAELIELTRLDPSYRAVFADGSELSLRADRDLLACEIGAFAGPAAAEGFHRWASWLDALAAVEVPNFIDRDFDSIFDAARDPRAVLAVARLGAARPLASKIAGFFDDPRLQRAFSFQALYAGLSPFNARAAFGVISWMDVLRGVYFPTGGMHAVPRALATAAEKAGAEVRLNTPVERIEVRAGGRVRGVRTAAGVLERADCVVSNVDLPIAYRRLLDADPPRISRRGRYSPSCLLRVAGVRSHTNVRWAHHNVHFGSGWRGAFESLMDRGMRMHDPSLFVSVPTLSDPSLAPEGHHVVYALEPVPNLAGRVDWSTEREPAREQLIARLDAMGYPVDTVTEIVIDPADWQRMGCTQGTPFSLAHRFFQSGPFRPPLVDRRFPGLVHTGAGTRPGAGVPMVLLSGRLAADRVDAWGRARVARSERWRQ